MALRGKPGALLVADYKAVRQLILQCIYLAIAVLYAILTSNDQLYYCLQIALIRKFYSHIVVNKLWLALEWYIHAYG